jgi:hypothetical protein
MKWEVFITEAEEYILEIEADNQLDAEAKAREIMEVEEEKQKYHNDSKFDMFSEEID